ncbi:hypothetical protein QVD17_38602 [Tagetes erecta]|uniref:Leucine-rich repeat-containing N-terminal plant-type domain-containing protein n=1 Tax=Tagetes erecta TaxID=13708 RepID=A0AAD8JQV3_TARER|nr:hypothetical protein QVD17_38602 [Tagetes erecta]
MQTIFSIYVLLLLTCTTSLLSHDQECLALFEFKQTFLHQNHAYNFDANWLHKFDSWRTIRSNTSDNTLSGFDCCLWDGVVCSNKGHVIELDLSGSSLTGVINSSSTLFMLVHLQMLNLSMNNFYESQIPSEIACLNQLRSLDLSNSGFNGLIPNKISHLRQLTWLDLSMNPLKLQSHGFEYLSRNMTRLEVLYLSGVDLSSSISSFLVNFSSLSYVELIDCQLQDEFQSAIFLLPKLKYLSMRNNSNLTGSMPEFYNTTLLKGLDLSLTGFTGTIPESISNLNHLEYLDLQECYFSGHIPGLLPNLTQITYLNLYGNKLTGIVPSLASLSKLTTLNLGFNGFEIGLTYAWINKLTMLNELYINTMNIHEEILPYLANLTKLSIVAVEENFISGPIPSSFMNLTQLTLLDVRVNLLHGHIPSSFSTFKSLKFLDIGFNYFSGTVSIDSFLGLNNLENLYLDNNNLSFEASTNYTNVTLPKLSDLSLASCNMKEFPAFLRYQKNMIGLVLNNNEIEGHVPNWIWINSRETLQFISLANNFITGFHQHPNFLQLVHLKEFDMSYNRIQGQLPIPPYTIVIYQFSNNNLSGEIPLWICELKSLQFLDLSSNNMTGTIPSCLSNLNDSLLVLNLKQNNFYGPMKYTCMYGSSLKVIELSKNQFIGHVSKSLANCTNLEFLSLAENSFEDIFPVWLGTLPNLQVLNLKSNKFYGAIQGPSTLSSQFPTLRIIDISNNNFSGQLPNKLFWSWNAMKNVFNGKASAMGYEIQLNELSGYKFLYSITLSNKGAMREYKENLYIITAIDLSCNNFEGQIPQSLEDLHGLESLNLSNNHFTGHILPSLGNLKNLESLDLSQNELSGQIPKQLLQLGFLAILNVSFNHLDGSIPQGKQFNTFENHSYMGNPGLCGKPLSQECKGSKVLPLLPRTSSNEYESLKPVDRIDWMVISIGFGSGLVIGIVLGNFIYARYADLLLGMRKDKYVRPLRNMRRN